MQPAQTPKREEQSTKLHGITFQKTVIVTATAVENLTSNTSSLNADYRKNQEATANRKCPVLNIQLRRDSQ
jgi:hypothetical protein